MDSSQHKLIAHRSKIWLEENPLAEEFVVISIRSFDGNGANLSHLKNDIYRFAFDDNAEKLSLKNCKRLLEILQENDHVLVQCEAGISRSAAIAKFARDFLDFSWVSEYNYNDPNKMVYQSLKDYLENQKQQIS